MDLIERPVGVLDDARRHPWEVARARTLLHLVQRLGLLRSTVRWLDVGAGDAWFAGQLRKATSSSAEIVCWDTGYDRESSTVAENEDGLWLTAERPAGRFDGVLMLDVVEHVEDDLGFVSDIVQRSLAPAGWVLVTVPAYQALFSEHDRVLRHFRRYAPAALGAVLQRAGLQAQAHGSFFHSLLPLRAGQVLRERLARGEIPQGVGSWGGGPRLSRVLTAGLELEGRLSVALGTHHLPTPPGLSTWALCRRTDR